MEKEKLQQLDSLVLALGFADTEEKLENCINKYLLTLLNFFRFQNQVITKKVLEILSIINQRIKHASSIKLPLPGLIDQFYDPETPVIQKNFTIIYVVNAFERSPIEERMKYVNKFLVGISQQNPVHQSKLIGLSLQTLCKSKLRRFTSEKELEEAKEIFPFFLNENDKKIILEYLFYFILSDITIYEKGVFIPDGLSTRWKNKLSDSLKFSTEKDLDDMKIAMINILDSISPSILKYQEILLITLAAKSDLNFSVSKAGEDALRRIDKIKINLEDPALVNRMFEIYNGTEDKNASKEDIFSPVSPQFKLHILVQLKKSTLAANSGLKPVKMILDGLNGETANMKTRQAALAFAQWNFIQASQPQITIAGQIIFSYVLKLLRDLKNVGEDDVLSKLKDMLYLLFTPICKRIPATFTRNFDTLEEIFTMFMEETQHYQIAMQDGLFLLTTEFQKQNSEFKERLFKLVEKCSELESNVARYLAVYYAIRVFPFSDVRCRYICLKSLSHPKQELREEAKKGLSSYKIVDRDIVRDDCKFTDFPIAVDYISSKFYNSKNTSSSSNSNYGNDEYDLELYSGSLQFIEKCFIQELENPNNIALLNELTLFKYQEFIEFGFTLKREHAIHLMCAKSLYYLCGKSSIISQKMSHNIFTTKSNLLYLHHAEAREYIAKVIATLCEYVDLSTIMKLIDEITLSIKNNSSNNLKDEILHGDILALGSIIGKLYYLKKEFDDDHHVKIKDTISLILKYITDKSMLLQMGATQSIGIIARYSPLPLEIGEAVITSDLQITSQHKLLQILKSILILNSSRESAKEQLIEKIVLTIADIYLGVWEKIERNSDFEKYFIDIIFSLSKNTHEEVLFTSGEALSCIGSAWGSKIATDRLLLNESSEGFATLDHSDEPMQYILTKIIRSFILSGSSEERVAGSIWLLSIVQNSGTKHSVIKKHLHSIQRSFTHMLASSNDLIQEVGSKGLVLVYDYGDQSIKGELVSSLVSTLSKGSKGFKSNQHGDEELFPSGMLGKTPDGTEGNLNTYKELSSLASDMGKPELMYKFLNLSSHNQIWSSKKGAAFATKSIMNSAEAKAQLQPYLKDLVPKLFRYSYDPNPRLAQSMSSVLNSMVDTSKIIDLYFDEIIKELIEGIGSRVWRVRESSLLAISEAVRSRNFDQLAPYFEQVYYMVFRGMDDIKESVAKAGISAAKSLAAITSRICDPLYTTPENVTKCLEVSIPFLLDKGINNLADEVKLFAIDTIHSITKSSGKLITPFVPKLVSILLENLSLYEPALFNYIDQKTEEFGTTKDELEDIRVKISANAPMSKTIDLCSSHVDKSTIKELSDKLASIITHGVGMPTRVGTSKFICSLVRLHPDLIKPYSGRLIRRLTSTLTNRSAAIRKANATAIAYLSKVSSTKSMVELLKFLSELYIDKAGSLSTTDQSLHGSVVSVTLNELSKYSPSQLSTCSSECIPLCFIGACDIVDESNKQIFQNTWNEIGVGGSERIYADEIVESIVKCLNSSSWALRQQGSVAVSKLSDKIGINIEKYVDRLLQIIIAHFKEKRIWNGKEKLFLAISSLVKHSPQSFIPDINDIKNDSVMDVVVNDDEQASDVNIVDRDHEKQYPLAYNILNLFVDECARGESEYKRHTLSNLNIVLETFSSKLNLFESIFSKISPIIQSICNQLDADQKEQAKNAPWGSSSSSSSSDASELGKEKARKLLILGECFEILGNAWPIQYHTQSSHILSITNLLTSQLLTNTWNVKIKILISFKKIILKLDRNIFKNSDEFIILLLKSLKEEANDPKYSVVREHAILTLKELVIKLHKFDHLDHYRTQIQAILNAKERENSIQLQIKEIFHYLNIMKS